MARQSLRGTEYTCDHCEATEHSQQPRVPPEGWLHLTVTWTIPGRRVQDSAGRDLCPDCAKVLEDAMNLGLGISRTTPSIVIPGQPPPS